MFFLKISNQSNKISPLVVHFVAEIPLEILNCLGIRLFFATDIFLPIFVRLTRLLFLSFSIKSLIKLDIFS